MVPVAAPAKRHQCIPENGSVVMSGLVAISYNKQIELNRKNVGRVL